MQKNAIFTLLSILRCCKVRENSANVIKMSLKTDFSIRHNLEKSNEKNDDHRANRLEERTFPLRQSCGVNNAHSST